MTGFVAVSAEPGVAIKTLALAGLTEIPASALPGGTGPYAGLLAFKYFSAEPQSSAPWKLTLNTEAVESWVRAEVANFITVGETLISGRALVRYDIQNAPTKEFRLNSRPRGATWKFLALEFAGATRPTISGAWNCKTKCEASNGLPFSGSNLARWRRTNFILWAWKRSTLNAKQAR